MPWRVALRRIPAAMSLNLPWSRARARARIPKFRLPECRLRGSSRLLSIGIQEPARNPECPPRVFGGTQSPLRLPVVELPGHRPVPTTFSHAGDRGDRFRRTFALSPPPASDAAWPSPACVVFGPLWCCRLFLPHDLLHCLNMLGHVVHRSNRGHRARDIASLLYSVGP